jgi:triacylglycerol lipase
VDRRVNDGIVPTLSQLWGEVIRAVWADHHDVIGHFHHPTHVPPHFDWVASGTGFTREGFEALWDDVAEFIAAAA